MFCVTKEESLMRDLKKKANKQAIDSFIFFNYDFD